MLKAEDWLYSSYRYYHKQSEDNLVDGYGDMDGLTRVKIKEEMVQEDFERGSLIGSSFFRFQFFKRRKRI